jgi:hypothetical protein
VLEDKLHELTATAPTITAHKDSDISIKRSTCGSVSSSSDSSSHMSIPTAEILLDLIKTKLSLANTLATLQEERHRRTHDLEARRR